MEAGIDADLLGRLRQALVDYQAGPLMDYTRSPAKTKRQLAELTARGPRTLAIMHGSTFVGDGAQALREPALVMEEVLGSARA